MRPVHASPQPADPDDRPAANRSSGAKFGGVAAYSPNRPDANAIVGRRPELFVRVLLIFLAFSAVSASTVSDALIPRLLP